MKTSYQLVKVVLVGDNHVGKTSLMERVCDDKLSENYRTTLGIDFKNKNFPIDGKKIKLQILDTVGQERFRNIASTYYRLAAGIILVYDVSDEFSFNNIEFWAN